MGWKEKTPKKVTFGEDIKIGQSLTGRIDSCTDAGSLGVKGYTMTTEDGEFISFLGNTILDKVLPNEVGNLVKLTYKGRMKTSNGFTVMQFDVAVWEEDSQEQDANKEAQQVAEASTKTTKKK